MHTITLCETFNYIIFVFPNTLYQIRCNTNIQRTISTTGKNINTRIFVHCCLLDSGFRRNDDTTIRRHYNSLDTPSFLPHIVQWIVAFAGMTTLQLPLCRNTSLFYIPRKTRNYLFQVFHIGRGFARRKCNTAQLYNAGNN